MIHGIKGVKDILPSDMSRWHTIEQAARRTATAYGYQEIRIPVFEVTELFARSIGATTDIVEKEMYTFADRDGKSLTLRPEATAGVVRAYIEHNLGSVPTAQKLYYLGAMFRHERPQAGRLRQFHQFGIEAFGSESPLADAEVISLLWRFLSELEIPDLTLHLNSLGSAADRPRYKAALQDFLTPRRDQLCENCRRRLETNPLRVLDCKNRACRDVTEAAPRIGDYLSERSRTHFLEVTTGLDSLKIPYTLEPRLVRGLDYYTLTIFEVTSGQLGAQNAVGAGGRYDGLVEALGGPATPAVGFAAGLERIALLVPDKILPSLPPLVYVAGFGQTGLPHAFRLLDELRATGVRADTDYRASSLKSHLRQADRLGALLVAILGDDEANKGSLLVRNMETKEQEELPLAGAAKALFSRLKTPRKT
jgi:histidyl-tRNA synthetase